MADKKPTQSVNEITFELADLFSFLWKKKFRLMFTSALIIVATGYYIFKLPKIYSASSTILLGSGEQNMGLPSALSSFSQGNNSETDTYLEFIRSRQFLKGVVETLFLTKVAEFRPKRVDVNEEKVSNYAIGIILNNLVLSKIGTTDLIKVTYYSQSPMIAAEVANLIGPAFFSYHADMTKKKAGDTSVWLNNQLTDLQDKLLRAENAMQEFIEEHKLIGANTEMELVKTELATLLQERMATDKALSDIKATVQRIEAANGDAAIMMQIPWVMNNPMVENLRNNLLSKEQSFAELKKRYKSKHHKFIVAEGAINDLETEQKMLLSRIFIGLKQSMSTLAQRLKELKEKIEVTKTRFSGLSRYEIEVVKLKREIETTQNLYQVFVSRLQETELLKGLDKNKEFVVIDYAVIPQNPTKPRVVMLMSVTVLLAIVFSSGFWLILHLVSDRKTRLKQLLRTLDVPLLAEIPKLKTKAKSIANVVDIGQLDRQFSEAIRSLRTEVLIRSENLDNRIIALTGIKNGDGKTTLSISLALAFAKLEKVILIDSDLRSPTIAKSFGLATDHPGISNLISRQASFSQCVFRHPDSKLRVLPSGPIPADPMIYISTSRFAQLIKKLGVVYERVVLEAPPLDTVSDTLVLSRFVDGIILVCDVENTDNESLIEAVHRLRETGAPLLGVVFNKVKDVKSSFSQRQAKALSAKKAS
jgi:succinoglycan biosynthesis transport protein ExoP